MSAADEIVSLLVVGGGPAGLSAARAYRERGGGGRVLIASADDQAPYARPPLSKDYLRGDAPDADLPMQDETSYGEQDVELMLTTPVVALDLAERAAHLTDGRSLHYRTCVVATGSEPVRLPVPGGDDPALHVLRSADDARRLRDAAPAGARALVVGSGFIGCEAAVSLRRRGLDVVQVTAEEAPQHTRLGPDVAERLRQWLVDEGVRLLAGSGVDGFERRGPVHRVVVGGTSLECDLVLVAAGVRQRVDLAQRAGATTHQGRVLTDERMRTSVDGLLAAGDVVFAHNPAAGRRLAVEHWGEALAMGEVAGATAAGADAIWDAVPGFWSQIGDRMLKQAAWGDGWDSTRLVEHPGGGFTAWYGRAGVTVGVLTHEADEDYERGSELVRSRTDAAS